MFYKKATVFEAQPIDDEFPEFLEGADITHNPDGSWSIKSKGNTSTGFPGKAYWVKHGIEKDGTISANILTKSELSYREYIVCDENGNDLGLLCELDQ